MNQDTSLSFKELLDLCAKNLEQQKVLNDRISYKPENIEYTLRITRLEERINRPESLKERIINVENLVKTFKG